jgi:uncharacterized membrane protein SirB2
MELYPTLRAIHVACVTLSLSGFALRGAWMLTENALLNHRLTRVLPHLVDTLLLGSAIGMVILIRQFPFNDGWLTAKLVALLVYIVLGSVALRRGRTVTIRLTAFVVALAAAAYLVAVALTRSPWPPAALG